MSDAKPPSGKSKLAPGVRCLKKTITLSPRHHLIVQMHSEHLGLRYSEMIRRMIDQYNSNPPGKENDSERRQR